MTGGIRPNYFIYQHIHRDFDYLMRVKTSFSTLVMNFEKSRKKSLVVAIYPGKNAKLSDKGYTKNNPIKVRLIRVELGKGNVEILMTSLLDSNDTRQASSRNYTSKDGAWRLFMTNSKTN